MIIQKVFSNPEEEEMLYSVLLNEEELGLFSEIQKEFTGAVKRANKAFKRRIQGMNGKFASGTIDLNPDEAVHFGRELNPYKYLGSKYNVNGRINFRSSEAGKYLTPKEKIKGGLTDKDISFFRKYRN